MSALVAGRRPGWPLILADLALILFLITLTGLDGQGRRAVDPGIMAEARGGSRQAVADAQIAPAQALYRPLAGGLSLRDWLASQPHDPRATLTVFAHYAPGNEAAVWAEANALAREAAGAKLAVRTILTRGEESDIYASLAYDTNAPNDQPAL